MSDAEREYEEQVEAQQHREGVDGDVATALRDAYERGLEDAAKVVEAKGAELYYQVTKVDRAAGVITVGDGPTPSQDVVRFAAAIRALKGRGEG
jgi:hypothetical protein